MGGLKHLFIMEWNNLDGGTAGITESAGVVTAIDKVATKRFWKYVPARQTASHTETITGSEENGTMFYAQEATLSLNKMQASVRNEVLLLGQNKLVIIAVDQNNTGWLLGKENGLFLNAGTIGSGTAAADRNGYTMTFSGQEREPAPSVDSATLATLETPGS